jgi:hypothetical protein
MSKLRSITEQSVKCCCGWSGTIGETNCDADYLDIDYDGGRLRCPECAGVVVVRVPIPGCEALG